MSDTPSLPANYSGVVPSLCLKAELGPPRTECGVGALMPWADRLWVVTYVSHKARTGVGTGLYEIDENLRMTKRPESVVGTYANRFVHFGSNQLFIGPHVIDADRNVRTIDSLIDTRITATMTHLTDPEHKVYMLGMEGEFCEVDVNTLEVTEIDDLTERLGVTSHNDAHFKAGYTSFGRVVVANNSYDERDHLDEGTAGGRLAEWDGKAWTILERTAFVEVHGRGAFGGSMFAMGWDRASAILKVFTRRDQAWSTYRLPKASHCFEHMWQTEWPRIREVEHERFLMDCHGMFYELSPHSYGGKIWGVRPVSTHLWVVPDFCSYRGLLVLGSDNASPHGNQINVLCGEPQSGLWFGKTDDLWRFGKPQGWGGPWVRRQVEAGEASDPYLMTGFDKKMLHVTVHEGTGRVAFDIDVDYLGDGEWHHYGTVTFDEPEYSHHEFPDAFSAHWVRLRAREACRVTAYFTYT